MNWQNEPSDYLKELLQGLHDAYTHVGQNPMHDPDYIAIKLILSKRLKDEVSNA
jgi:hypothetical protein